MALPNDLNLLLTLALLLKTKSVTGTAAAMGLSQPSVSRALQKLRQELGDPLLVRSGNGMTRTRRGDELVDRLADWIGMTSMLLEEDVFDPAKVERRFRIASTDFGVLSVLLPAIPLIQARAPGIAIDIVPLSHATHRSLAEGEIDLAVSGLDHDPAQVHRQLLFEDELACLMAPGHPLAARDADAIVTLDEFLAHPHVGVTVSDAELDRVSVTLGAAGRDRRVVASLPYFMLAPDLIAAGGLMATMPQRAARHFAATRGLVWRRAPAQMGRLQYWLLWHERGHRDRVSQWLRDQLAEASRHAAGPAA